MYIKIIQVSSSLSSNNIEYIITFKMCVNLNIHAYTHSMATHLTYSILANFLFKDSRDDTFFVF
jgi:hypothetical protein